MAKTMTAPAPAAAADQAAPTHSKKKLLIIGVALVAVLGAAWFFFLKPSGEPAVPGEEAPPVEGEIVDVAELTVNLSGSAVNYARVGFAAVLEEGVTADVVTPHTPLLKDAAISEIARFTPDRLRTPEGADELRAALSARATEIYPEGEILRVVLTSLIVQ